MRVVCQQPAFFPWLGYFEQIRSADAFVYLDQVQWSRQARQHRTRLPAPAGAPEPFWLTVPVQGHGHRALAFRELRADHSVDWPRRHWETLRALYGKSRYFHAQLEPLARPFFESASEFPFLLDLCERSVSALWEALEPASTVWHGSDLDDGTASKTDRLLKICEAIGAREYYSALGASRYLEREKFRSAGLNLRLQHFRAWHTNPSRPGDYSVLDWLAHCDIGEIRRKIALSAPPPALEPRPQPEL